MSYQDPNRPKPAYKNKVYGQAGKASSDLEGAVWTHGGNWKILANWPANWKNGIAWNEPELLWEPEFAQGAHLEKWTEIFLGDEFWAGTEPLAVGPNLSGTSAKTKGGEAWDEHQAIVSDRINAIFADAHRRNRWDLLHIWYPLVWDRFARAEQPWVMPTQFGKFKPEWQEVNAWPGWAEMEKASEDNRLLYESGSAVAWLEKIRTKRTNDGLPTPEWLGPWVNYMPYWWIVPNAGTTGIQQLSKQHTYYPGKWIAPGPGFKGTTKLGTIYPLGEITESDKINDIVFAVALSVVVSTIMAGVVSGLWSSMGVPELPALTDAVSSGLTSEATGGNFEDGFLDSFLPEVGSFANDLGAPKALTAAADIAAGNNPLENSAMLLDSFTDGLGWLDDAVSDANDFLSELTEVGSAVDQLSGFFGTGLGSGSGGYVGSNGYPSAPPIFEPGPDGVGGTAATPKQLATLNGGNMGGIIALGVVALILVA